MKRIISLSVMASLLCAMSVQAVDPANPKTKEFPISPEIRRALDWSGSQVTHSHRVDGTVVAEHNGTLQHVMFSRLGQAGNVEYFCTDSVELAQSWLASPPVSNRVDSVSIQQKPGDAR